MGQVSLRIIGCGDAFCSGGRGNTCFYLRSDSLGIAIDFGATALQGIRNQGISTEDVDIISITHFHGDHAGGLPYFLLDAARLKRQKPLTIITPTGGKQWVAMAFQMAYPSTAAKALDRLNINYLEFDGIDRVEYSGVALESYPVVHSPETLPHGIRLTVGGKTVAYTGDTEWTETISSLVKGADMAICDCTFFEKEEKNHLNYKTLRKHINKLQCRRLMLTHFDEEMLRNLKQVSEECAFDGKLIKLP
jgi:ribonuclease BN (tRNA processing enzyme)